MELMRDREVGDYWMVGTGRSHNGERCMFTSGGNPPSLADCLAALLLLEL